MTNSEKRHTSKWGSMAYAFLSYNKFRSEEERVLVEFADCSTIGFENESDMKNIPDWVRFYKGGRTMYNVYLGRNCPKYIWRGC